jgi:tetratricopeptide (TPR) repeat protein
MKTYRVAAMLVLAAAMALLGACHQVHEAKARQLTRSAREAFFEGEFDKALEHSEIALRLGSKEPELHRVRSAIFLRRGDAEAALKESDAGLAGFLSAESDTGEIDLSALAQSRFHTDRSQVFLAMGRAEEGLATLKEAVRINPENPGAQNNLAWLLATAPGDTVRDGAQAVEHARRACELTDWNEAGTIDTLAAAHAEAGDFEQALKWQREAIAKMSAAEKAALADEFAKRLALYESGQPYREDPVADYREKVEAEANAAAP